MRVAIDVSFIALNQASGVRTYALRLLEQLVSLDSADRYLAFYNVFRNVLEIPRLPGVKNCVWRIPRRLLELCWTQLDWPAVDWLTGSIDVFHSLHYFVPPQKRGASVLTVHDLREFRFPELYPHWQSKLKHRARMAQRADMVVTVSESTRQEAIHYLGLDPERVRVVLNGYTPRWETLAAQSSWEDLSEKWALPKDYFVFLSSEDPRKGFRYALDAFERYRRKRPGSRLVVAGRISGETAELARRSSASSGITIAGVVSDQDLAGLLRWSKGLLFMSLYEGFGLPILEAFGCATPVIGFATSSMPEVSGDAAILVPLGDTEAVVNAMFRLSEDAEFRQEKVALGLRRLGDFSWGRAATQLRDIYQEVYASKI